MKIEQIIWQNPIELYEEATDWINKTNAGNPIPALLFKRILEELSSNRLVLVELIFEAYRTHHYTTTAMKSLEMPSKTTVVKPYKEIYLYHKNWDLYADAEESHIFRMSMKQPHSIQAFEDWLAKENTFYAKFVTEQAPASDPSESKQA